MKALTTPTPLYPDSWEDMDDHVAAPPPAWKDAAPAGAPVAAIALVRAAPPSMGAADPDGAEAGSDPSGPVAPIPLGGGMDRYPGLLARCSIFKVGRPEGVLESYEAACYGEGYRALFEGPRLGMRDKRIWEAALRAAKEAGSAGVEFALPATAIAKALGAGRSSDGLKKIGAALDRLRAARIDYRAPDGCQGSGTLLASVDKHRSGWRVSMDAGLVPLLRGDMQFRIDVERRELLRGDLAKWMHDFLSTHKAGFKAGFKLGALAELCGWKSEASKFPSSLAEALEDLRCTCPASVAGFEIQRCRRGSSSWRARVERGPESEKFEVPAKREREKERRREKSRPARSGGVCL